jgi:hypothetical protein
VSFCLIRCLGRREPKRTEKHRDQKDDDGDHHRLGHVGNGSPDEEAHDAAEDGEHADQEEGAGMFRKLAYSSPSPCLGRWPRGEWGKWPEAAVLVVDRLDSRDLRATQQQACRHYFALICCGRRNAGKGLEMEHRRTLERQGRQASASRGVKGRKALVVFAYFSLQVIVR